MWLEMKESLTDYLTQVSGDDISILEDIISNKYLKFKKFFELLRPNTKNIKKFEYTFCEADVLNVNVTFKKKVSLDDKKELIESWKKAGYAVDATIRENTIHVVITYKE